MSDDWTRQHLREIRRLAPDYGWQDKDGDVIRWTIPVRQIRLELPQQ